MRPERAKPAERLLHLITELTAEEAEKGGKKGAQSRAMERIGKANADPTMASTLKKEIAGGKFRDLSTSVVLGVCEKLDLRPAFFFDRWERAHSYVEYLATTTAPASDGAPQSAGQIAGDSAVLDLVVARNVAVVADEITSLRTIARKFASEGTATELREELDIYLDGMRARTAKRR